MNDRLGMRDKDLKKRVVEVTKWTKRTESSILREALERFLIDAEDVRVSRERMNEKRWSLEDVVAGRYLED